MLMPLRAIRRRRCIGGRARRCTTPTLQEISACRRQLELQDAGHLMLCIRSAAVRAWSAHESSECRGGTPTRRPPMTDGETHVGMDLYRFARATAAFSRRLAPGTERVSSIASFTLWLMPSKQGVKIIAVGAIVATA